MCENNDMKPHAEISITQEEFLLLQEVLEETSKKHMGIYKRTLGSGYGKASTETKAIAHKDKAEACNELLSKIAYSFM
jgi:hypothetical protein